jgi:hypothetical protein
MKATPKLLGASLPALEKGGLLLTLAWLACAQSACALRPSVAWPSMLSASSAPTERCILITGANKGQGFALCKRILAEHGDTHVFLCSRDARRGEEAAARLASLLPEAARRVDVVPLDVTEDGSVSAARSLVERKLDGAMLYGVVSNAGVMWGHSRRELMDVCALGVRRVLDAFVPLTHQARGRVVVVSSGLGPLMHGYAVGSSRLGISCLELICFFRCASTRAELDSAPEPGPQRHPLGAGVDMGHDSRDDRRVP